MYRSDNDRSIKAQEYNIIQYTYIIITAKFDITDNKQQYGMYID